MGNVVHSNEGVFERSQAAYEEACRLANDKAMEWGEPLQRALDRDERPHVVSRLAMSEEVEVVNTVTAQEMVAAAYA